MPLICHLFLVIKLKLKTNLFIFKLISLTASHLPRESPHTIFTLMRYQYCFRGCVQPQCQHQHTNYFGFNTSVVTRKGEAGCAGRSERGDEWVGCWGGRKAKSVGFSMKGKAFLNFPYV